MTGSLSRNGVGFDDIEMTENVCQIYISYDNKLSNDSFSYAVVYNDSETVKPANGTYHIVKKIVNTNSMQVIEFDDCTVAVFHADGKYISVDGTNISGHRGQIIIN